MISAGRGAGRNPQGIANFANDRRCAKNFGNAMDSELTAAGVYVTGETRTSLKGYYRASATQSVPFLRSFIRSSERATPRTPASVRSAGTPQWP